MMYNSSCEKAYKKRLFRHACSALLILILIFLFLEGFSRWIAVISPAPFGENIRDDQKFLVSESIKNGIVALGDSVIARGFYPEIFSSLLAEKLDKPYNVYNIGVDGSGIEHHKAYLHYLLKKKIKPAIVIMNVSVHNLNLDNFSLDSDHNVFFNRQDDSSMSYYSRCVYTKALFYDARLYCRVAKFSYFFRLVHFYRQQMTRLSQFILHTNKWRQKQLFVEYPPVSEKGFSATFGTLPQNAAQDSTLYTMMQHEYKRAFARFKLGTEGLDSIVDELNANSIKVILVLAPVYQPLMRKLYDEYGLPSNETLIDTLKQYAQRKQIAFINLFEHYQNPVYFQDPVHLNSYGAIKMTSQIAKAILAKQIGAAENYLDHEIFRYLKQEMVRTA